MPREQYADTQRPTAGHQQIPYPTWDQIIRVLGRHALEAMAGTVAGTGAALDVVTAFDPAVVLIFNQTDLSLHVKTPTMAGDDHFEHKGGTTAYITTNGITLGTKKFTLGTHANLNAAADAIHWIAFGFRDQNGSS